jgi:hypothetical protein
MNYQNITDDRPVNYQFRRVHHPARLVKKAAAILLIVLILSTWISPMISNVSSDSAIALQDNTAPRFLDAKAAPAGMPALNDFAASVLNGNARQVVGVYVSGQFALPILQQPANNPAFVPAQLGVAAQFGMAADYNTIAFLAHNTLSGEEFFKLQRLDEVVVIYGDGSRQTYVVTNLAHYQALSPNSPYSNFVNLDQPGEPTLSAADVFTKIYMPGKRVVFQTCIRSGREASWGRLFVTAVPLERTSVAYRHYEAHYNYSGLVSTAWAR